MSNIKPLLPGLADPDVGVSLRDLAKTAASGIDAPEDVVLGGLSYVVKKARTKGAAYPPVEPRHRVHRFGVAEVIEILKALEETASDKRYGRFNIAQRAGELRDAVEIIAVLLEAKDAKRRAAEKVIEAHADDIKELALHEMVANGHDAELADFALSTKEEQRASIADVFAQRDEHLAAIAAAYKKFGPRGKEQIRQLVGEEFMPLVLGLAQHVTYQGKNRVADLLSTNDIAGDFDAAAESI